MSCIGGVHVLDGIYYNMWCYTERHVLLEVMFYLRACIIGGHVLLFKMSYWGTCFTRGHILQDDLLYRGTPYMRTGLAGGMSYRKPCITCLTGGLVLQ